MLWSSIRRLFNFLEYSGPRVLFTGKFTEMSCFYCGKPVFKGNAYDIVIFTHNQQIRLVHRECADGRWHKGKCRMETI